MDAIDARGQDAVGLRQPVDLVRVDRDGDAAPSQLEIGVVVLRLGLGADRIDEGEGHLEVGEGELAAQMVVHIIESLTHRVVIHPRPGDVASDHAEVITRVVTRFLCDGAPPPSS